MGLNSTNRGCSMTVFNLLQPEQADSFLMTPSIVIVIINGILSVTATLGNGLIIAAILRSQNLRTPSYLLITSLAFTDLLVGLVIHPLNIAICVFYLQKDIAGLCGMSNGFLFFISFLALFSLVMVTCISVDRYLALTLRHRYPIVVTKKRVRFLIILLCVLSFPLPFLTRWRHLAKAVQRVSSSIILLLLLTTCYFYIKSFRALHLYTVQVHAQQPNPLAGNFDVVRYKKTLKTMLVVLACLLLFYIPAFVAMNLIGLVGVRKESLLFYFISRTTLCLNSSINPVIYLLRFKDIRNACIGKLKSLIFWK